MLSVKHILAPVEFNDACISAASCAYVLACRLNAQLTLLHVTPTTDVVTGLENPPGGQRLLQERACSEMQRFHQEFAPSRVSRVLEEGDPAREIVRYARNHKCDLVFMPTRGRGPFRRLLLGSVTAKVLHDADCPVWTGVHPETFTADGDFSIARIGCAADLGPQTRAALRWAGDAAATFHASLIVFHVLAAAADAPWQLRQQQLANEQLASLLEELGLNAETHVTTGNAARMIPELASGFGCDLTVTGRGHMSAGARLGGHAYAIIRDSVCPVVSV